MEERLHKYIDVALSGGGHRASLFSLGVLLYMVDAAVNQDVRAISSVSGGSITNGYVAQECDFRSVNRASFHALASDLMRVLVHRGMLAATWVSRAYYATLILIGVLLLARVALGWPGFISFEFAIVLGIVWVSVFFLRGVLLDWIFGTILFRNEQEGRPTEFRDLDRDCVHVFCSTDLVLGRPFYFVALGSGYIFGFGGPHSDLGEDPFGGWGSAESVRLQTAIRASAALPGAFPPKRFRYELDQMGMGLVHTPRRLAFLADGGVWNNLATQWWSRSHGPPSFSSPELHSARTESESDDWVSAAHSLLVVNASAPPRPEDRLWLFSIPLLSEIFAFVRSVTILYRNTLTPRIAAEVTPTGGGGASQTIITIGDEPGRVAKASLEEIKHQEQELDNADTDETTRELVEGALLEPVRRRIKIWNSFQVQLEDTLDTKELQRRCLGISTNLSRVSSDDAIALVTHGYLLAMEALYIGWGTPLLQMPSREAFARLLNIRDSVDTTEALWKTPRALDPGRSLDKADE